MLPGKCIFLSGVENYAHLCEMRVSQVLLAAMSLLTAMRTDCIVLLLLTLGSFSFVGGDLFGRNVDDTQYGYGCLTESVIEITCDSNDAIEVIEVAYGGEPLSCSSDSVFTDNNDCQQISAILTERTQENCNGLSQCNVPILQTDTDQLEDEEILPLQDNCAVGDQFHSTVYMNYMVIKYRCKEFKFCTSFDETPAKQLIVATKSFPEQVVSNPKCKCTFSTGSELLYVQLNAMCNGTVTFIADETVENAAEGPDFVTKRNTYYCNNNLVNSGFVTISVGKAISMDVSIDVSNSSEYSSFSLLAVVTETKIRNGYPALVRNQNAEVLVSCSTGGLWLPKTVVLILSLSIPLTVTLLIVLVVVCKCVKRRRKKAKEWRKRFVPLRHEAQRPSYHEHPKYAVPSSPLASHASSTPSSTRRKPDGKLDSDSEENLTQIAARLHRQNTERKAEELRKREAYHNNNSHIGLLPSLPGHMNVPHSYSQQYELGQQSQAADHMACRQGDRRCMSIGNLRQTRAEDANDDEMRTPHFNRPRSASQSRQNSRSRRPAVPTASPPLYGSQIHMHKNNFNAINHDNDDPDLTFDDPRYGNRSRQCTPVRDMTGRPRVPLYGEQLSQSTNYLPHPNGAEYSRSRPLHGTKSASHSRTSLRSTKRRAPLPPGQSPSTQRRPVGKSNSSTNTPVRSRAGTPRCSDQRQEKAANSNYAQNSRKNELTSAKPKYFNPYAVKYPPLKPKPKNQQPSSEDCQDSTNSPLVLGQDLPKHERRRYSDTGSLDESEHGMDDIQTGVLGDLDVDMMEDDQW